MNIPTVIGHRGAAAHAPENTLGSFATAAELGSRWIEFDVRLSRNDMPVIVHDHSLARTTGIDRPIDDVHSDELGEIDAGSWFDSSWSDERIPTLAQAVDACVVLGLTPNIELKPVTSGRRELARAVCRTITRHWRNDAQQPLISSFSLRMLYHVRSITSKLPLALLMWEEPLRFWVRHMKVLGCESIHVDASLATPDFIQTVHRHRRKLGVYTVDDREEAEALLKDGVDYVFSNTPALLDDR